MGSPDLRSSCRKFAEISGDKDLRAELELTDLVHVSRVGGQKSDIRRAAQDWSFIATKARWRP
jgi:hypothetical protein